MEKIAEASLVSEILQWSDDEPILLGSLLTMDDMLGVWERLAGRG